MYLLTINAKAKRYDSQENTTSVVICKNKTSACAEINRYLLLINCFDKKNYKVEDLSVEQINQIAKQKIKETTEFLNRGNQLKRKIFVKLEKMEF